MTRLVSFLLAFILLLTLVGCGGGTGISSGGGGETPPPPVLPPADFAVSLNDFKLSLVKGSTVNTIVGISGTSEGSLDFEVEFSVTGLPNGVHASFTSNPFLASQPAIGMTLTADANAETTNFQTISVTAERSTDNVSRSATLTLFVAAPPGSLPNNRADFIRTDGTPAAAIYDPVHDLVFASNPQWNRVDVISVPNKTIVDSIAAPSPTGMDLSLDGKRLLVGSNMQQIVTIDMTSHRVVSRADVTPVVNGGAVYATPNLLANTSNGSVLVGMTLNSSPPAYKLEKWDPVHGTFSELAAPGVSAWINRLVRSSDGKKVLVVDYGSDANLAVYDAPSDSFTASGYSQVGQILAVAANPATTQFAIVGLSAGAIFDADLNPLFKLEISGAIFGLTYSADGSKLYASVQLSDPSSCVHYPIMLTYETGSYSLEGISPVVDAHWGSLCDPFTQSTPLAANNSGLVFGWGGLGLTNGLIVDDATNFQNVLTLPAGPPFPQFSYVDEAALNQPLQTGLGQIAYDVLPDVWFGDNRGLNTHFDTPLVAVTAPPSSTAGLINVKANSPDGWFALVPSAFSYGSKILFLGGNVGSQAGGASVAIVGYGLLGNNGSNPLVTIGGQPAEVTARSKYRNLNDSGFNASYPFVDVDEVIATVPPGPAGTVDVEVRSEAGTAKLSKAFTYVPVNDYSTTDAPTFVLYDSQRHQVYLSAGDHIDVFSTVSNTFLTPIVPPSLSGVRKILGLALTPDKSKLLAANFADISVAIMDPQNPSAGSAVRIPVTESNAPGVAAVVATSTGKVFVDGVSGTFSGCGGKLFELDLTSKQVKARNDIAFPGLQVGGNEFSRSSDGSRVALGAKGCGTYLWNAATDKIATTLPLVSNTTNISGDGYWTASDFVRLDQNGVQHTQPVIPQFFSDLLIFPDWFGEKMNASGSLLYTPEQAAYATSQSGGIEITETNNGKWLGHILLAEQVATVQSALDYDEAENRFFMITDKGLTVVDAATPPLAIGYLTPAIGSTGGGTAVTIRGSGFDTGVVVKVGNANASVTWVDESTLHITTPAGSAGGSRVTITNPDGEIYSLDSGFRYQ